MLRQTYPIIALGGGYMFWISGLQGIEEEWFRWMVKLEKTCQRDNMKDKLVWEKPCVLLVFEYIYDFIS